MCKGSAPEKPGQVQTLATNNRPPNTVQDGFHLLELHGGTSLKWLMIFGFILTLGIAARKLYRHAKKKEQHKAYQPPKQSTYEEVLRGPSLVTEQAMAHFQLQNMRQNQPMLPPPTVRFQGLTKPSSPPLPRQWKFGERNSHRRQRQEAIIHPSPREEDRDVRLSPSASSPFQSPEP